MNSCSFNLEKMLPLDDGEVKDVLTKLCSIRDLELKFESKTLKEYLCSAMVMFPRLCNCTSSAHSILDNMPMQVRI